MNSRMATGLLCGAFLIGSQLSTADAAPLDQMISPVSHPVTFEDPRHSTELRPIFAYHEIDEDFVTGGGHAEVYALQARLKLTDDLSLIATKDGYVVLDPKAVVPRDSGFADVAVGAKYSVYRTDTAIVTTGLRYEAPVGDENLFQGLEDGAVNPFISTGYVLGDVNLMAGTGLRAAISDADSSFWDVDLHADIKLGDFYPLLEVNLIHPYQSGDRLPIADEGEDFFNFGASNAAGKNILTMAAGARYRLSEAVDVGAAYQFPLDRGEGSNIIDWRVTCDLIIKIM